MYIIGDVHGRWKDYKKLINLIGDEPSIQIGDMGIGFDPYEDPPFTTHSKFFPGNHDNPDMACKIPNCLGRFGYLSEYDIYFISGAFSIDYKGRVPGYDWWFNEQLNQKEWEIVIKEVEKYKPKIILSHDGPMDICLDMFTPSQIFRNNTGNALQYIYSCHQPEKWIFGHWHRSRQKIVNNTLFVCLAELESLCLQF